MPLAGAVPVVIHAAPHPDDELLGAGATLMALRDAGWRVVNLACGLGRPADHTRRRAELSEACRRAGFELELPDGLPSIGRDHDRGAARRVLSELLASAIERHGPSLLIGPSPHESHHGHETVGAAIEDAVAARAMPLRVMFWGLWSDLRSPTVLIGFDSERLAELQWALAAHAGELARNPFERLLRARAEMNAVIGPERVFGFGAQRSRHEYAELLTQLTWSPGEGFARGSPRELDAELEATRKAERHA